jgi:hypothetical protein
MRYLWFVSALAFATHLSSAALAENTPHQPDDHAPIGVMGDHLHKQGEWMVGYHYQHTRTSGYRNGAHSVSNASVMRQYGEAATEMDMGMHMLEVMYGVSDHLTLMVMPQYMTMDMTHKSSHGRGHSHDHKVKGLGDTEVSGLYAIFDQQDGATHHRAHLHMGVSLPTGSIDKTFTDHHDTVYHLPYAMQFGSGTVDPIIGATYTGALSDWSWGAQTLNYVRMGKNDNGYRLGNRYTATTWLAHNVGNMVSVSARLKGEHWDDVSGRDANLPLRAIAGANPNELAGERVMAYVGLNLLNNEAESILHGHRLAAELGVPVYERTSGAQPDTDYQLTLAWQFAF